MLCSGLVFSSLQRVSVCFSVFQCVAVCCSVLYSGLVLSSLQCVAVCCSGLQCVVQWSSLFIVATLSKKRSHWQNSPLHMRVSMHCWHPI